MSAGVVINAGPKLPGAPVVRCVGHTGLFIFHTEDVFHEGLPVPSTGSFFHPFPM